MKRRMVAGMLAAMISVSMVPAGMVYAEEATEAGAEVDTADLEMFDLVLTIGSNSYDFPMSLEDCRAAGLNVPENVTVEENNRRTVAVDNGRNAFDLQVVNVDGELWATGYAVYMDKTPTAAAAGHQWEGMTKSDVRELFTGCTQIISFTDYEDSFAVRSLGRSSGNHIWWIRFDGTEESSVVRSVEVYTETVSGFAKEYADNTADEELPDVAAMSFDTVILNGNAYDRNSTLQDFLDNGWEYDKGGSFHYMGNMYSTELYNGENLIFVRFEIVGDTAEETVSEEAETDGEVTEAEAAVVDPSNYLLDCVEVGDPMNSDITIADGLTLDSALDEFEALLGAPSGEAEGEEALFSYKAYTFDVLNKIQYTVVVVGDDVIGLGIENIQQ